MRPVCGASAAPAGGSSNPAPGRLRDPARPALRPVCEELAALGSGRAKSPFAPGFSRKRGPRLSGGVRSPKREPRWSAERRARPQQTVRASELSVARCRARKRIQVATLGCAARTMEGCACRRSASLRLCRGRQIKQSSDAHASREEISFSSLPGLTRQSMPRGGSIAFAAGFLLAALQYGPPGQARR